MKYVAPVAERVDFEAVSVVLTSAVETTVCELDSSGCENLGEWA